MSMNKLSFEIQDGIAVLTLDNPPVNSLGVELRQALTAGVERANADPKVAAIVLIGSGAGFSGGADIREFGTPKAVAHPNLRTVISEIEDSAKPVIAAVGGVCMGGGLELAMACHYRVGVPGGKNCAAGSEAGVIARCRRYAAAAAAARRRGRTQYDRLRRAGRLGEA